MGAFAANRVTAAFGLQDPRFQSLTYPMVTPTTIATAANVAYTAAQVMSGFILRNPSGTARSDTLPTAASLVAAIQGCMVNTSFQFEVRNSGTVTVTLVAPVGGGVTIDAPSTVAIPTLDSGTYLVIFTNVTPGQEAYSLYSLGVCPF